MSCHVLFSQEWSAQSGCFLNRHIVHAVGFSDVAIIFFKIFNHPFILPRRPLLPLCGTLHHFRLPFSEPNMAQIGRNTLLVKNCAKADSNVLDHV